jgi:hypothetical protein
MFQYREEGGLWAPKSESPIEVAMLAMERMEKTAEDLGGEVRCVWKRLTIRMEDIE